MFSIIIPLYNKAPYIEKAIRSVVAQTFQDFELIIIDDGSIDNGRTIAEKLLGALSPPLGGWGAVAQKNQGVSTARNNGVAMAKYDYIAFLDADDWWAPTYLEEMKALIEKYPEAGIYGSSYFKVKGGQNIVANIGVDKDFESGLINYFQVYAKTFWMPLTSISTIIKKAIYIENNGFKPNLKLGEDFDLWVRIAIDYPVAFVNKALAYYNQDVEQVNRGVVDEKIYEPATFITFNLDYLATFEKSNSELKILLDRLRVYSLLRYKIQGKFKDEVNEIISNVNFKNVERKYFYYYNIPPFLLRKWFAILKQASRVKKIIRNLK